MLSLLQISPPPEPLLRGHYLALVSSRVPSRSPPPRSITDDTKGWQPWNEATREGCNAKPIVYRTT